MIGAVSNAIQIAGALLSPVRKIGPIFPDIVVEESHFDFLRITDHPVERGADTSDHAFKAPAEVMLRCGWSNSSAFAVGLGLIPANPFAEFSGTPTYVQKVYDALIRLQNSRIPFDVFTGKRLYKNMLLQSLNVINDHRSEYALLAQLRLREIIIVSTWATKLPEKANQSDPASTGEQQQSGTKQATTVDQPPAFDR